jgi:hypothetical protein
MSRQSLIGLVAACALALAGCGGGGGSGGGNTGVITEGGGAGAEVDTNSTLYQAAYGVCSSASPAEIKNNYRTKSTKPEDIASDVSASLAGGNPLDQPNAKAGCLAGLKAFKGG